ncbi:OsmC family peroxiredoxin [Pedobacter psychrodurus]|uniref:OsmC family peroxiredoxin n=1 Tax=Pedobacter psychrodurus TaxID=2530456 RepID=A0A4V2MRA6_9SPHI|nr:OsmC family protein [Pedobacter psychrodurus]TCD28687.1 OsmC family peroxiredoxin [Pedobacter psychrodurus]
MKYLLEKSIKGIIRAQRYKTYIEWRNGTLITDEPEKIGGKDLGPDPYSLLLSSLVACTLATLRMYLDIKEIVVREIIVEANIFNKIEKEGIVVYIERKIVLPEITDQDLHSRLLRIAESCPISKILKSNIKINTDIVQ